MESALVVPSRVRPAASLFERTPSEDDNDLDPEDSAFCALTDLRREYPITVEPDCCIDDALADMTRLAVHALLATRQERGGGAQQLIGLISRAPRSGRPQILWPGDPDNPI